MSVRELFRKRLCRNPPTRRRLFADLKQAVIAAADRCPDTTSWFRIAEGAVAITPLHELVMNLVVQMRLSQRTWLITPDLTSPTAHDLVYDFGPDILYGVPYWR